MTHNPINATYWKKQALEARALARRAGEALDEIQNQELDMPCRYFCGEEHGHSDDCQLKSVLSDLRASGILKGGE